MVKNPKALSTGYYIISGIAAAAIAGTWLAVFKPCTKPDKTTPQVVKTKPQAKKIPVSTARPCSNWQIAKQYAFGKW
jgi:dihydroorotase-like cyclic amidohydrolase